MLVCVVGPDEAHANLHVASESALVEYLVQASHP